MTAAAVAAGENAVKSPVRVSSTSRTGEIEIVPIPRESRASTRLVCVCGPTCV